MNKMKKTKTSFENTAKVHKVWHKFYGWLIKKYGMDLYSEWQYLEVKDNKGKKKKLKYKNFNEKVLSEKLIGYEVMKSVKKYIKRYCPEIKIVSCDDAYYAGSYILLIPHPEHGITILYIPQCTGIQNQFFLYENYYKNLLDELKKMKYVYKNTLK